MHPQPSWRLPFSEKTSQRWRLLRLYLARVDEYNGALNAIVVDVRDQALEDAAAADKALAEGKSLGPFHGVPMTFKESYNLTGTPTTWGNPAWKDNIAKEDAEAVKRLKEAGVIVFGKTNVPLSLADFRATTRSTAPRTIRTTTNGSLAALPVGPPPPSRRA